MAPRAKQVNVWKQIWEWAEETDPKDIKQHQIERVYRVKTKACAQGNCRRNCKANPNCFNALGERLWFGEIKDNFWVTCEDPEASRRPKDLFVGLKNLGATCYVNTFLQLWFHNPVMRSALYRCVHLESEDVQGISHDGGTASSHENNVALDITPGTQKCNSPAVEEISSHSTIPALPPLNTLSSSATHLSVCGHLQLLFSQLQYSTRRFIDPTPFINSLGLDTGQQQDAQEFSKLFMSLLEETLSHQPNPEVRHVVQNQFRGDYHYVTECQNCQNRSKRLSRFYELDLNIQGHSSLNQCIKEFLKEEKLDGDNQYFCTNCSSKQNAERRIELHTLPPVLNLQLLRFVFDRKTGCKKKLNSFIQFPDVLDMTEHLKKEYSGPRPVYELTAVLIHHGPTAHSGHYVAHIRDRKSGVWYKFNDEEIKKMEGKLKLVNDEDLTDGTSAGKKPRCGKGFHTSKNAYMLVYTLQSTWELTEVCAEAPPHIQELVATDNSTFDEWARQVQAIRDQMVLEGNRRQCEIQKIYQQLPVQEETSTEYEWITTKWIRDWLSEKEDTPPVDNSSLLCSHGKLDPDQVQNAKGISKTAAEQIFLKYGGHPRIKSDSMCMECVRYRCKQIRFQARLADDHKFLTEALKSLDAQSANTTRCFWVGRSSLVSWKKLASSREDQRCGATNGHCEPVTDDKDTAQESPTENNAASAEGSIKFNEDLLCEHRNLSSDASCRKLVPATVWERLKYYFPSAPEFSNSEAGCSLCRAEDEEERLIFDQRKRSAAEQRTQLSPLYHQRNRPQLDTEGPLQFYVICRTFLEEWRSFLRWPTKRPPPEKISNSCLLCPHGNLLFNPELGADELMCYVWNYEWDTIVLSYPYDVAITATKEVSSEGVPKIVTTPELCAECNAALLEQKAREWLQYRGATVYVRKITKDHDVNELLLTSPQNEQANFPLQDTDKEEQDPDFKCQPTTSKKQKLSSSDASSRRSSRHRKQRGEVILNVDSTQTLRDIKLQLMKSFSVMPMDQHLSLNGSVLQNDQATLGSLGVHPGSLLLLKIDEPRADCPPVLHEAVVLPEEGFKENFRLLELSVKLKVATTQMKVCKEHILTGQASWGTNFGGVAVAHTREHVFPHATT